MIQGRYAAVINTLEGIDRTGVVPQLSGPIGRFFRTYAQHRLGVVKLCIDMNIQPARDGTLLGKASGVATLRFIDDIAAWDETETEFGVLYHVPALCDEFLSPITLRLWSNTGPGAEGIHSLVNVSLQAQGIQLQGNFKWKPPSVLVPNRATFNIVNISDSPQWLGAYYLKHVGEDIEIDPHPLSYVPIATRGNRMFVAMRVVAGVAENQRSLVVPFATKPGLLRLRVRLDAASTRSASSRIKERRPSLWLVVREPDNTEWVVLDACEATNEDIVLHSCIWGAYLRNLTHDVSIPGDASISLQTTDNLSQLGLAASPGVEPPALQHNANPLALRRAEQMRFPEKRIGLKVLKG